MHQLTVKEVADLKGCSLQYIKRIAKDGELPSTMGTASNGRPCYLIPLSALDVSLQRKWYKSQAIPFPSELKESPKSQPAREAKPLEAYTIQQREQIDYWIGLLERWQDFRSNYPGPCSEADQAFHQKERLEFSIQTLYR
ncbi:MAG: MerR family transcriptional regulator, partial [Oscillospiraceae bacterium]